MVKKRAITLLAPLLITAVAAAQSSGGSHSFPVHYELEGNDTISVISLPTIYVRIFKKKADLREYERLIYNLKRVYPIAKHAKYLLDATELKLQGISSKKERAKYIKEMEVQLKKEYTPILKKMTYSQGKLLIKLIDRETERTTYELVKDLRGSFSAFLWQGVAKLFTANLKATYDPLGEDATIEYLIEMYEAGIL